MFITDDDIVSVCKLLQRQSEVQNYNKRYASDDYTNDDDDVDDDT